MPTGTLPSSLSGRKWVVLVTILVLLLLAGVHRFVQDDAFISFRYAENMAHGHGLVWNPGEQPVEGYTNFLWTVLLAGAIALGFEPVSASMALGLLAFLGTLLLCHRAALSLFESDTVAWLAIVFLGTNYTFSSFATGGLETQLQVCLSLAVLALVAHGLGTGHWPAGLVVPASLAAAACMLTRLDSVLLLTLPLFFAFVGILRERAPARARVLRACGLTLPFIAVLGAWLWWKLATYGDILPNTYYAKASALSSWAWGVKYVYRFAAAYWLLPFVFLLAPAAVALYRRRGRARFLVVVPTIALWLLYVVKVGGDFMEFRFMVPVLPWVFLLVAWIVTEFILRRAVRWALALMVVAGSFQHAWSFGAIVSSGLISTIPDMASWLDSPGRNWIGIGLELRDALPEGSDVSVAVTAAGAIPFYSKLPAIDMLGLCDEWIARHGTDLTERWGHQKPGHTVGATYNYLLSRGTNLVIEHPFMVQDELFERSTFRAKHYAEGYVNDRFFYGTAGAGWVAGSGASLVRIPIGQGHSLLAVYLTRHPEIEALIHRGAWQAIPIVEAPFSPYVPPAARGGAP